VTLAVAIEDLEWKYEHASIHALRGVRLEVVENTFLGIVGANEQGKTTLVNCIQGLIPHAFNGVYRGSVKVFGREVRETSGLELAGEVGLVFADPDAQFTAMTVEEELVFGLENLGYDLVTIRQRLEWATEVAGIGHLLDRSPYDMSGGQKQRVAIACVLAMSPRIVIMDEPTSMLDPLGKRVIFDMLRQLKQAGDRTIIIVEHNIEHLAPLADTLALVHQGQIVRLGPPQEFFADPDFLAGHGVYPPDVTLFGRWLMNGRWLPSAPMPLDLPGGIAAVRTALSPERPT
jgi:energy-coupling factor transport system ATP-binding protein